MSDASSLARQSLPAVREMPSFARAARIAIVIESEDGTIDTIRCDDVTDITMTLENDWAESTWELLGEPELLSTTLGVTFKPRFRNWYMERREPRR